MAKIKKTDLERVVLKSKEKEADKTDIPGLEISTVKLPVESEDKGNKPKEKIDDGEKGKREKARSKPKRKVKRGENKVQQDRRSEREKAAIQDPTPPGRKRRTFDEIIGRILPPWFY